MSAFQSGSCGLPAATQRRRMTLTFSSLTLGGHSVYDVCVCVRVVCGCASLACRLQLISSALGCTKQ